MIRTQSHRLPIRWTLLAVLLVGPLVWAGCDATTSSSPDGAKNLVMTYEGDVPIKHSALGDGLLDIDGDGSVSFRSPTGEGGVRLDVNGMKKGDFYFQPAGIGTGETFTTGIVGRQEQVLAQMNHRRSENDTYRMTAELGDIDVQSAKLQLRSGENVLYEAPLSPTTSTSAPVGKSSREPTSWHYGTETVEGETITVITVDYEQESTTSSVSPPPSRDFSPKSTTHEGQAMIWPSGTKKGPFPSTHVSLVLEGTSISPGDVAGVSLSGAKELTIFNAALGNAY